MECLLVVALLAIAIIVRMAVSRKRKGVFFDGDMTDEEMEEFMIRLERGEADKDGWVEGRGWRARLRRDR